MSIKTTPPPPPPKNNNNNKPPKRGKWQDASHRTVRQL